MQPHAAFVAFRLLRLHGCLLLHPFDQDPRSVVLKILFPLRVSQLDPVLLHAIWGIRLGKHNFLDEYPGARVSASQY